MSATGLVVDETDDAAAEFVVLKHFVDDVSCDVACASDEDAL